MEIKNFNIVVIDFSKNVELEEGIKSLAITEFSCDGIEDFSLDEPTVDSILGERAYSGGDVPESVIDEVSERANAQTNDYKVKFYFFTDNCEENAKDFYEAVKEVEGLSVEMAQEEYSDWNDEWRKHYRPIEVSSRMTVIPEWFKEEGYKENDNAVYIYPGMGFGTGEHETTFLCLKHLDNIRDELPEEGTCLDFGCGSGILGIGTIKMKNMLVEFCDIDPAALDNCVQNLELNLVESRLNGHRLVIRNRFTPKKYDIVFANILEHVLKTEKEVLLDSLKPGSFLILSGILNEQVDGILEEYSSLENISVLSKGDWSAILMKKN
ncbi:50S ribosomal protein L11 methyltransferase [Halobacteriovorax sp. GB3]|uniref:50S ribosomal protein L11 methyltransferase n=1 Tax=Halobacteriovorax sp. GB3 TaxID=2719615 RepID=UPI00235E6B0F|nr:50S ribosomal protein L11 methyltransferase [Halobacteriovorax sp. GB3]MDD0854649.1 50S ribosomal protein L11 methyltransferase [Halobacteriovorax sp. GB3]